jgi:flagellar hook-basal body complex protein FliE
MWSNQNIKVGKAIFDDEHWLGVQKAQKTGFTEGEIKIKKESVREARTINVEPNWEGVWRYFKYMAQTNPTVWKRMQRNLGSEWGKLEKMAQQKRWQSESAILEFSKYRLGGLLDSKLKKRLERTIKVIGGKVDAVGDDYIKFRMGGMDLNKLPAVIKKLDRNKNVWIGDKYSKNIWDRKRNIDRLESVNEALKSKSNVVKLAGAVLSNMEDMYDEQKNPEKAVKAFGTMIKNSLERISRMNVKPHPQYDYTGRTHPMIKDEKSHLKFLKDYKNLTKKMIQIVGALIKKPSKVGIVKLWKYYQSSDYSEMTSVIATGDFDNNHIIESVNEAAPTGRASIVGLSGNKDLVIPKNQMSKAKGQYKKMLNHLMKAGKSMNQPGEIDMMVSHMEDAYDEMLALWKNVKVVKKESVNEAVEPQGNMAKIAKVVKDKQATKLSGVMIDMQSANLLMKLWDAVSDKDKEKMNKMNAKLLTSIIKKLWSRINLKLPI